MTISEKFKLKTKHNYVYYIVPIKNINSIMNHGLLSFDKVECLEHSSIAMSDVQMIRERVIVPPNSRLHSYANMYFSYWNPMLCKRQSENENICILAINASIMDVHGCVFTDRNAATGLVKFYDPIDGLENIDFDSVYAKYWATGDWYKDKDQKAKKCAEILIPDYVPYEYISKACVVSNEAKLKLLNQGFDKEIYVNSECFF